MKKLQYILVALSTLLLIFHFSSCELFEDDEHCQNSKGVVEEWKEGYPIYPWVEIPDEGDEEDPEYHYWVKGVCLGVPYLIEVDDICNSEPATVSAELYVDQYRSGLKFWVIIQHINEKGYRSHTVQTSMSPTTVDATKYILDPTEIPIWPDFATDDFSSSPLIGITIYLNISTYIHKDELIFACETIANTIVKDAKISLSYTQY